MTPLPERAFVVALVGAESTGKTTLARAIGRRLASRGLRVSVIDEVLREFCDAHGRTPRIEEQAGIAGEQTRRIDDAAAQVETTDVVVADTTALMIAVYSELVFADRSLYASALAAQHRVDLTLVTANDLPWQADGLQRDGPHVREPVATLLEAALDTAGIAWSEVGGMAQARVDAALAAVDEARDARRSSHPS